MMENLEYKQAKTRLRQLIVDKYGSDRGARMSFAKELGCGIQNIYDWTNSIKTALPGFLALMDIAKIFPDRIHWLLTGEELLAAKAQQPEDIQHNNAIVKLCIEESLKRKDMEDALKDIKSRIEKAGL